MIERARRVLVTGGAGFIGSAVVRHLIAETDDQVGVVDKLTYAGNLASLAPAAASTRYRFFQEDIADGRRIGEIMAAFAPDLILHLAAESHVDRSIAGPAAFVRSNVVGTFALLEAALAYWRGLDAAGRGRFRFQHVSTDEVFGSRADGFFDEGSPYRPNSPYSASKAGADHLVRAWHATYGLPATITYSSNNFGPYQHPEKLVPMMILNALAGLPLPLYGDGRNVRDWLYVEDHVRALLRVAEHGRRGETYAIGAGNEISNRAVVEAVCAAIDRRLGDGGERHRLIRFVADRPGHDFRYALDAGKVRAETGWRPRETFASGLEKTIDWYLANPAWWTPLRAAPAGGSAADGPEVVP